MYTLYKVIPLKQFVLEQVPSLGTAWIIAEIFYKFKSFTFECAAFLATWFLLDAAIQLVSGTRYKASKR
jgi:hypothetical protein